MAAAGPQAQGAAAIAPAGSWTLQTSGTTASLAAISAIDAGHAVAVGAGGTIIVTENGGRSWTTRQACASSSPCTPSSGDRIGADLLGVSMLAGGHGWAVGLRGTILATSDGGATWTQQLACAQTTRSVVHEYCRQLSSDRVTADLRGVSFVDDRRGWVVGSRETILHTSDGGATWAQQIACGTAGHTSCPPRTDDPTPLRDIESVSFGDALHGMVVGTHGYLANTIDGGANWQLELTGNRYNQGETELRSVTMTIPRYGREDTTHVVGAGGRVFVTGRRGQTWYGEGDEGDLNGLHVQPPPTAEDLDGVDFANHLVGRAVGAHGTILGTADEGGTWTLEPSGTAADLRGVVLADADHGFAVGDAGTVLTLRATPVGLEVTGLSPAAESSDGRIPVVITGRGFTGATEVSFGRDWARGFSVDSDTQITANPPVVLALGSVQVTVTKGGMTSDTGEASRLRILPGGGGRWRTVGACPAPCDGPAVRLLDGRVLAAGNAAEYDAAAHTVAPSATAAVYDPSSSAWQAVASMPSGRRHSTATLLADGRVLVAGGLVRDQAVGVDVPEATAEIFDPASGRWTATGTMAAARSSAAAVRLPDGRVLVTGGLVEVPGQPHQLGPSAGSEIYDSRSGTWAVTGSMHQARSGHFALLLRTGRVMVIGDDSTEDATAELFDPATSSFSLTAGLALPRRSLTATLLADGRVLVVGGYKIEPSARPDVATVFSEIYDPRSATWHATGPMVAPTVHAAAAPLPDGRVLVAGGTTIHQFFYCPPCGPIALAEILDPATGGWSLIGAMDRPRPAPVATALADGTVLVTDEDGSSQVFVPDASLAAVETGGSSALRIAVTAAVALALLGAGLCLVAWLTARRTRASRRRRLTSR